MPETPTSRIVTVEAFSKLIQFDKPGQKSFAAFFQTLLDVAALKLQPVVIVI